MDHLHTPTHHRTSTPTGLINYRELSRFGKPIYGSNRSIYSLVRTVSHRPSIEFREAALLTLCGTVRAMASVIHCINFATVHIWFVNKKIQKGLLWRKISNLISFSHCSVECVLFNKLLFLKEWDYTIYKSGVILCEWNTKPSDYAAS